MLKLKKYITKKRLIKLAVFLVIAGGAWLFDYYHQGSSSAAGNMEQSEAPAGEAFHYFCSPVNTFSLKAPASKQAFKKFQQKNETRFMLLHHSQRLFHLLKAESLQQHGPCPHFRNLTVFRECHAATPDDQPPLA